MVKIGKHKVELYDSIDSLPVVRYHKYQKALLIDAGIGGDIVAFDQRIEKVRRYLMQNNADKAKTELENLRQCVYLILQEMSPKTLAFATLVKSIDGKECKDVSDEGLKQIQQLLSESTEKEIADSLDSVKKKIDYELTLYFPSLFNQSDVKEYYDLLKKRTLALLKNLKEGKVDDTKEIEDMTTQLITYGNPRIFSGSDGLEIQHDRQFENLCLALSSQLNIDPKRCSVMEFYNAFDYLKEKNKRETGERRAKSPRK